jgi:group I intron endonuclease
MGCGIYKIENIKNKKLYVGSSVDLKIRKLKHFWMLKKGIHDNIFLQYSYNKFGKEVFLFSIIEECEESMLVDRENFFIDFYNSNNMKFGYNLATVTNTRRNVFNMEVKTKMSKTALKNNGNFIKFSLTNINTNEEYIFESLVDDANYLINSKYAKGKPRNVRMSISNCLRGIKLNNGHNGSIRKTCYKHNFKIIK